MTGTLRRQQRTSAGTRRERRRRAELQWTRHVPRALKALAAPCPRCGAAEYFGCTPSCWKWAPGHANTVAVFWRDWPASEQKLSWGVVPPEAVAA